MHEQGADQPSAPGSGVTLAPGVSVPGDAVRFAFSRSGGPGGQNVNKVATKAELRIALGVLSISPSARHRLIALAGRRLTDAGDLVIVSESERSQGRNRDECLSKLRDLLVRAMAEPKVRRRTRPTKGSKERRLREKKARGEIKKRRQGG
ncbi:MAG: aminoacyl-tRNA hydrolase [Phycisphaeraceae bacterium]|nr:aminoacyl-tRNA hydrolase [Phycisphaeraceae bacterium]